MSRFPLKLIRLLLATILFASHLLGCTRRSSSRVEDLPIEASITISPDPAMVGPAVLEIQLKDASGEALTGAMLSLRGDMTHAGMQPVLTVAIEIRPGTYQASMDWTMAGDWILTIEGTLPDGTSFTRQVDVKISLQADP